MPTARRRRTDGTHPQPDGGGGGYGGWEVGALPVVMSAFAALSRKCAAKKEKELTFSGFSRKKGVNYAYFREKKKRLNVKEEEFFCSTFPK